MITFRYNLFHDSIKSSIAILCLLGSFALAGTPQTISFPEIECRLTTDPAIQLSAIASSNLPVSFTIVAGSGVANLNGNVLSLTGTPGVVTIRANQAGDASFETASPAYSSLIVQPPTHAWKSIAQGNYFGNGFTVAVRADGTLWSWGTNFQFGNLGFYGESVSAPTQVGNASDWKSVSARYKHVLALKTNGSLWSWGSNDYGQLGQTGDYGPVEVQPGTTWRCADAGGDSSMAVRSDGSLWGWGSNGVTFNGVVASALGDGTTIIRRTPFRIGSAFDWSYAEVGRGIKNDGSRWAWGGNYGGALGDGTTLQRNTPVSSGSGNNWKAVSESRGIKTDGTLWSWGSNYQGIVGDGTTIDRLSPVQIGSGNDWNLVWSGENCTRAIKTNGTLWAWGNNSYGPLGDGTTTNRNQPIPVGSSAKWNNVVGDRYHTVATKSDGSLWAWGNDHNGSLNYGFRGIPRLHKNLGPLTECVTSYGSGFVIKANGTLWAWGNNNAGQLGDGTTVNKTAPVQISVGTTWKALQCGGLVTLGIQTDGSLWAWGDRNVGDGTTNRRLLPVRIGTASDWSKIGKISSSFFAIKQNGTLWAWGENQYGTLGDGTTTVRLSPVQIGSDSNWVQVSCGGYRTMAVRADGSLWAWGNNSSGNLGDGTTTDRLSPIRLGVEMNWKAVSVGYGQAFAIKTDGTLWNWGSDVSSTIPTQLGSDTDWSVAETSSNVLYEEWDGRLSSRGNRTLALKANGTLWSWGANSLGELGTGNKVSTMTPTQIGTSNSWMKISAKGYDNLCLTKDGSLWGFGENASGLLGSALDFTRPIRVIPTFSSQAVTFPSVSATIGTPVELKATASSGLPVVYAVSGPATIQGNFLTINAPGAVNLVAYQEGDASWRASDPVQTALSIAPALEVQTITFPIIADSVPTSPAFTITASASSMLPVSFSLISGPATVSGNTVSLTGSVGTVVIRANQVGNASYAAANPETRSFTVASSGVLLGNWASSAGLSGPNTAPDVAPFNDGVVNLLKYAFNMNAAGPDVSVLSSGGSAGLPQIAVDSSGAKPVLKVAFLRRKGSGLIYTPQRSTSLGNFVAMTGTPTVTSIDAQWERVTVQEPAPPTTAPSAFARVQVSLP